MLLAKATKALADATGSIPTYDQKQYEIVRVSFIYILVAFFFLLKPSLAIEKSREIHRDSQSHKCCEAKVLIQTETKACSHIPSGLYTDGIAYENYHLDSFININESHSIYAYPQIPDESRSY